MIAAALISPFVAIFWLSRRERRRKGANNMATPRDMPPAQREKSNYGAGILGGIAILAALWWWFSQPRFSDADVVAMKASIREEYQKKGLTVSEVTLIRVNDRRLEGFVKLESAAFGSLTKECFVTLGDDGQSIWQCR